MHILQQGEYSRTWGQTYPAASPWWYNWHKCSCVNTWCAIVRVVDCIGKWKRWEELRRVAATFKYRQSTVKGLWSHHEWSRPPGEEGGKSPSTCNQSQWCSNPSSSSPPKVAVFGCKNGTFEGQPSGKGGKSSSICNQSQRCSTPPSSFPPLD